MTHVLNWMSNNFDMSKVFINYRTDDSASEAGRIGDFLIDKLGKNFVFRDKENFEPGDRWKKGLIEAGSEAKVVLAVIGPNWLQLDENGESRLQNEEDWVRTELELAIQQNKTIIPIFVNGGKLPDKALLPNSLHQLHNFHTIEIRQNEWADDIKKLLPTVRKHTGWYRRRALLVASILLFCIGIGFSVYKSGIIGNPPHLDEETLCPSFSEDSDVKVLMFPFSRATGVDDNTEHVIKAELSSVCRNHNISAETKMANSEDFIFAEEAQKECPNCQNDLYITGIAVNDHSGSHLETAFGFCDPTYQGFALNEDLLNIEIKDFSLSTVLADNQMESAMTDIIQLYLGTYFAKNNQPEKSNQMLKPLVDKTPNSKAQEKALKIIWQNEYKLGNKAECIKALEKLEKLNPSAKVLATKSVVQFEEKQYVASIKGFSKVIQQTNNSKLKKSSTLKRGDAYARTKQYQQAKSDYQKVEQTPEVKAKVEKVDTEIKSNEQTIESLTNNYTGITAKDKFKLGTALLENGNKAKAAETFRSIDLSKLNATQINSIDPKTVEILKTNATYNVIKQTVENKSVKSK